MISLARQAAVPSPRHSVCFGHCFLQSACQCGAEIDKARKMASKSWRSGFSIYAKGCRRQCKIELIQSQILENTSLHRFGEGGKTPLDPPWTLLGSFRLGNLTTSINNASESSFTNRSRKNLENDAK